MADPALLVRVFYLAASILVLSLQLIPALRSRFLAYGSRATSPAPSSSAPPTSLDRLLDAAAAVQVPHNYFTHFYVVSVVCSVFWGVTLPIWSAGSQLQVVWALMLLQGVRRLLESAAYTSSSKSTMWVAHWLLGLFYYVANSVAVWAEHQDRPLTSRATTFLVPAILVCHGLQHSYHAYLYELRTENKGYQLPSHPFFPSLLCPHYTCEIAIYLLLSFLAAPEGRLVNWSFVCGTIFVATNLGVTAIGTKEWYARKFGADKVGPRTKMIPWLW
jgi:3-oxo-5-alpha-steroid 4-dehydrogenase 3